jgi:hypothetical protein
MAAPERNILGKRVSQAKDTASALPGVGAVLWVFEMSSGLVQVGGNEDQEEAKWPMTRRRKLAESKG